MTHPHACGICTGILRLFEEAVRDGLRFTPEQRREMVAKAEKDIVESTAILASRGWFEIPDGSWRRLDLDEIQ